MMKRSLRIGWLVLRGCLAAATASLVLPQSFAAAQSTTQNVSVSNKLFRSVQANDLAGVQSAISEGADIQARDRWGMTPTDIAIDRGYYRIAHFLAASRNHSHDQNAASAAPSVPAKSAPLGISDARGVRRRGTPGTTRRRSIRWQPTTKPTHWPNRPPTRRIRSTRPPRRQARSSAQCKGVERCNSDRISRDHFNNVAASGRTPGGLHATPTAPAPEDQTGCIRPA